MAASGLETGVARAVVKAGQWVAGRTASKINDYEVRGASRALTNGEVARSLLAELSDAQTGELSRFLSSPELDEIALQLVLARLLNDRSAEETRSAVREQIRLGLKLSVPVEPHQRTILADVLFDALLAAAQQIPEAAIGGGHRVDAVTAATLGHLTSAAVANSRLLRDLPELTGIRAFAADLRRQAVALHRDMHLPHIGVSRRVPYADLYVPSRMVLPVPYMDGAKRTIQPEGLIEPGHRYVVLGSPGAGKSTLLAKLAYDIAADQLGEFTGRVPFLVTLRQFEAAFRAGERPLAGYLEAVGKDPYNVTPPPGAVEYLLRNGRAVILLDGLDELVDQDLRTRVSRLVTGFAHQHPLTPVVVTARVIGYETAPLDPHLFETIRLEDFEDWQVTAYATRWFRLDEATPEPQRAALTRSFLAESDQVAADLRPNPLLLALLCAMYSAEHYIPRNAAQIYEKCALMLFERWDSMRGVGMPLQFRGRVRGAVQYLAWLQLTGPAQAPLTESRIVRELTGYLERRQVDPDEAQAMAEDFLAFCTGRAWILTDVGGATYGFSHRTFMEFFAAEHIVRTHRDAEGIWLALAPKIADGAWDVVGQVAIQLYDRNVEDGGDEILRVLLDQSPGDNPQPLLFAVRALRYVTPTPPTTREIAARITALLIAGPEPAPYFRPLDRPVLDKAIVVAALTSVLSENRPAVDAGIASVVDPEIERGVAAARIMRGHALAGGLDARAHPADLYRYLHSIHPWAVSGRSDTDALMEAATPWIDQAEWRSAVDGSDIWEDWPDEIENVLGFGTLRGAIPLLPYLEYDAPAAARSERYTALGNALVDARKHGVAPDLSGHDDEKAVRFLTGWALGEFSVIG
jgi:hypothetical protein